jgi:methyl coenzyme M reductase beta subunit
MSRHVERRLDSWEWHRCGRCGGEFPAHGSYVLHDCDCDGALAGTVPVAVGTGTPAFRVLICPVPVRLEMFGFLRRESIPDHLAEMESRREWGVSPYRALYEAAALFEMSGADARRFMATFAHSHGIEP